MNLMHLWYAPLNGNKPLPLDNFCLQSWLIKLAIDHQISDPRSHRHWRIIRWAHLPPHEECREGGTFDFKNMELREGRFQLFNRAVGHLQHVFEAVQWSSRIKPGQETTLLWVEILFLERNWIVGNGLRSFLMYHASFSIFLKGYHAKYDSQFGLLWEVKRVLEDFFRWDRNVGVEVLQYCTQMKKCKGGEILELLPIYVRLWENHLKFKEKPSFLEKIELLGWKTTQNH